MKTGLIGLLLSMAVFSAKAQVFDPLWLYSLEAHWPYNYAPYDSIVDLSDTTPQANILGWGKYILKDGVYVSDGESFDGSDHFIFESAEGANTFTIYEILSGHTDTNRAIVFYRDQNGRDTASRAFRYAGSLHRLTDYRQYFYNSNNLIDSLHWRGYTLSGTPNGEAYTSFYYSGMRLDSAFTLEYGSYSFADVLVYDTVGGLAYEDLYIELGAGFQYYGRSEFERNSLGEIIEVQSYIDVNGSLYLSSIRQLWQTPSFGIRESALYAYSISPNPATEQIEVNFRSTPGKPVHFEIYTLHGAQLDEGIYDGSISLHKLKAGTFILLLKTDDWQEAHQIVKK